MRAVAAYQLATLLLQDSTTAKEGDELVWRLSFRLRLADEAALLTRRCAGRRGAPRTRPASSKALGDANLRSLAAIFGATRPTGRRTRVPAGFYAGVPLDDEARSAVF